MDTNTTNNLGRMNLTKRLEEVLRPFLMQQGFLIEDFGYNISLGKNSSMKQLLKNVAVKKSDPALMVKFSPDFIVIKKDKKEELFFLDIKTSITPVFFQSYIEKLKAKGNLTELNREDIGEVEREAWDTYNKFYPPESVVIVIACPYNQKLLLAERVSNILCFYKFEKDTNLEAGGSHTPHANIHLSKMRRLDLFLKEEFEIEVDKQKFNDVLEFIKLWDINKPMGRVNWKQYDNVIKKLKETCPWIKDREERSGQ